MEKEVENIEEIRIFFKELIFVMSAFHTAVCVDRNGDLWGLARWYGQPPHFRKNLGHCSESVLNYDDPRFLTLVPWFNHNPINESDKAWLDYYQNVRFDTET